MSLKDTVELLVKMLIEHKDDVQIEEQVEEGNDKNIVINLRVHQDDRGRLIGRRGKTINSIRRIIKAAAVKTQQRINIEVLD